MTTKTQNLIRKATELIDPDEITPYHGLQLSKGAVDSHLSDPVADRTKLASLAMDFWRGRYNGPPVLVLDDQALTGTHRLYAAKLAGKEIPVYKVDIDSYELQEIMDKIHDVGHYEDIPLILREFGYEDAAKIMDHEIKVMDER